MSKVKASRLLGFAVRTSNERPDEAVLELRVNEGAGYYIIPRDRLRGLAEHLSTMADRLETTQPPSAN